MIYIFYEPTEESGIMVKLIAVLGGVLALSSLLFGWWFSYWGNNPSASYGPFNPMALLIENPSLLIYNISPIYQAGSPGIQINQTTLGMHPEETYFAIRSTIIFVLIGGILGVLSGLVGEKGRCYGIAGGALVLLGMIVFKGMLIVRTGTGILFGNSSMLNAWWGLGLGFFVALAAAVMIILGSLLKGHTPAPKKKV
jgi:hypothetical protein